MPQEPPLYDPYQPVQPDPTLWFWNGRPCRIVQKYSFGDRVRVQIDLGGHRMLVPMEELTNRNIYNIPDNFRECLEILRGLLVKLSSDPMASQYNADELISKLQNLADAITGLQQQLASVQWGNVQGNIQFQSDLITLLERRVERNEFPTLWNHQMQGYLERQYHGLGQPLPPYQ